MSAYLFDVPGGYITNGIPYPMGQPAITYPLKAEQNYSRLWNQPFIVSGATAYVSGLSTGLFSGSYVVAESDREPLGAGCYSFNRSYAELPSSYNSYERFAVTFPSLSFSTGGSGSFAYRSTVTKTVFSRIAHDFFYTDNPATLSLTSAQRFTLGGLDTIILTADSSPTATTYTGWMIAGTEFVAEDATAVRYLGNIWDRQTRWVKAQ